MSVRTGSKRVIPMTDLNLAKLRKIANAATQGRVESDYNANHDQNMI